MRLSPTFTLSDPAVEDPEYGFREQRAADLTLMSLDRLQLLVSELRVCADTRQAIERVCDYVVHDPVYNDSTRAIFRGALENLRPPVG